MPMAGNHSTTYFSTSRREKLNLNLSLNLNLKSKQGENKAYIVVFHSTGSISINVPASSTGAVFRLLSVSISSCGEAGTTTNEGISFGREAQYVRGGK